MKIILIGSSKSDCVIKASKYLADKYLPCFDKIYLKYDGELDGWSNYLSGFLSYLTDENIMLALDDHLVADYIDMEIYNQALNEMEGDAVCAKLCHSTTEEHEQYPVSTQYAIWNREYLIRLLRHTGSPWNFEMYGSRIFEKKTLLRSCIQYNCNSALSHRWEGIDWKGLKEEDVEFIKTLA